jgi:DNA-binding NarL/FixJ family response regulator
VRTVLADYFATRVGIASVLQDEWEICGEAGTADEAIALAEQEQPDVCVIGLELPGGVIQAVRGAKLAAPHTAIVVFAAERDADDLLAVLRAGAVGYVPVDAGDEGLRRVMRAVAAGEAAVPRAMVLELIRELQSASGGTDGVTPREAQILGMLRRGQSTSAIASRLGISPVTVRRHISMLMQKTGAEDRAALTALGDDPTRPEPIGVRR